MGVFLHLVLWVPLKFCYRVGVGGWVVGWVGVGGWGLGVGGWGLGWWGLGLGWWVGWLGTPPTYATRPTFEILKPSSDNVVWDGQTNGQMGGELNDENTQRWLCLNLNIIE